MKLRHFSSARLMVCLVACFGIIWGAILLAMPTALFTGDELAQIGALMAMAKNGGHLIENGFEDFQSMDLEVIVLVAGPSGLVMQYPSGFTYLALPFWYLAEIKGVMALNLIAALAILAMTYRLALEWGDRGLAIFSVCILGIGTFLADYAIGVWPHAVATSVSLFAVLALVQMRNLETHGQSGWAWALLSGVAAGIAINVRVDTLFIVPALTVWLLWFGRRPISCSCAAALGMAPGLILSSTLNHIKFGSWMPVSYGQSGTESLVSAERYLPFIPIAVVMLLGLVFLRRVPISGLKLLGVVLIAALVSTAILVPETFAKLLSVAQGFHSLIIDMAQHRDVDQRPGLVATGFGTALIAGMLKQALAQSMPWLCVLPMAALARRPKAGMWSLFVLVIALTAFPFFIQHWHGGKSNSQRYLLTLLPFLSILGAVAVKELYLRSPWDWRSVTVLFALSFFGLFAVSASADGRGITALLAQPVAEGLFLIGLVVTSIAVFVRWRPLFHAVWVVAILGFSAAAFFAYGVHLPASYEQRQSNVHARAVFDTLGPKTIIHTAPVDAGYAFFDRPDVLLAMPDSQVLPDPELVEKALSTGWSIVTTSEAVARSIPDAQVSHVATDLGGQDYWIVNRAP
ncbi:MAG: hypothetical protein AAGK00_08420 [Pseudomonadota bacterium]